MPTLGTLADIRDILIIIYGFVGIIFFVILSTVAVLVGLAARGLVRNATSLMDDSVRPAVSSIKDAAETVRGTTDFMGRTAISPIVRTYGAFAGVKKGLSVLSGIKGRGR